MEAILSALMSKVMGNHQLQMMAFGLIVKVVVDQVKKIAVELDHDGTKKYKVPVELMVPIFSALAAAGDMYMNSQLETFDAQKAIDFVMTTLPIQLNAMGIHVFWSNVQDKTAKK